MRFLFTTERRDGPSTMWYSAQLSGLSSLDGVEIDFYNRNYSEYEVILFMGYDPKVGEARRANPDAKIGVIDVRPSSGSDVAGADFVLANGIEMKDWYSKLTPNVFVYPPYPLLPDAKWVPKEEDSPFVLAYHGNRVHLQAMYPRITGAIEALAETRKVEFRALYNFQVHGKWDKLGPNHKNVAVRHIQWSLEGFEDLLMGADVGVVPNLLPLSRGPGLVGNSRSASRRLFKDHWTDYITRFKATSNAGRVFPFAQRGIPVVSDMFPSALQLLEDGVDGYVCYSTASWFRALDEMASNPDLVRLQGNRLRKKFENRWAPEVLNRELVRFVSSIPAGRPVRTFEDSNTEDRPGGLLHLVNLRMMEMSQDYARINRFVRRKLYSLVHSGQR